jgi:uncharacterized membrane protein
MAPRMSDGSFSLLGEFQDEHLLHRLEAFSDIVIGFCLAELTFSLRPSSGGVLSLTQLYAFGLTFFLIVTMWWLHNRLFAKLFVINAVTIGANFLMLGSLMLMVYFFEGVTASLDGPMPYAVLRAWFVSAAVVYGTLAVMYGIGLWKRWSVLSSADLRFGVRRAVNAGAATLLFLGIGSLSQSLHAKPIIVVCVCFIAVTFGIRRLSNRFIPDEARAT